jgi:hypothetical protein
MKLKSTLAILLATASGYAGAADVFHPSNDEPGTVNHVVPGKHTRAEHQAAERSSTPSADSQWVFLGEEAGWSLRPHGYAFSGGRLVHNDPYAHNTPKPRLDSIAASTYRTLERD